MVINSNDMTYHAVQKKTGLMLRFQITTNNWPDINVLVKTYRQFIFSSSLLICTCSVTAFVGKQRTR